jgi:prevent-host-death family protein
MANGQSEGTLVRIDDLRRCLATAFQRLQLEREDAEGLAGLLLDSELRGHPDHGVAVLGVLATFYRDGTLNPRPRVGVLHETDGAILLDGDRGAGPAAPTRAMGWCIDRARERKGMAVAAVRDWQLLVAAPYVRLAAEAGLIGFACANFVPLVAPPGGRTAVLGTNPFAYGLPAQRHRVDWYDDRMTTQMTATEVKAKILSLLDAVAAGEEIEITKHGRTVARLVPAKGPQALKGKLTGIAMSAAADEELFSTEAAWDLS